MSAISSITAGALPASGLPTGSSLPATSLPLVDPSLQPESIRNGNATAKKAYGEGMAFEDILVNQLAQQMSASVPGLDGSDDGLGGTSGDSSSTASGLGGQGSGLGAYSSLLPQAMTQGIMSSGGTGIAMQIARAIDPALDAPTAASTTKGATG